MKTIINVKNALLIIAGAISVLSGCDRVDVAGETSLQIIPPVSTYNSNIKSYWKFDGILVGDGELYDSRMGIPALERYGSSDPIDINGKYNYAYKPSSSDGTSFYFYPGFFPTVYDSERFLVEAWVTGNSSGTILSKCNLATPAGWSCRISGGVPQLWYVIQGDVAATIVSSTTLTVPLDGLWHYVAFVYGQQSNSTSARNIIFYVDGNSESFDISSENPYLANNGALKLGCEYDGVDSATYFDGLIDDMAFWVLPEYISWDSISSILDKRFKGLQYSKSKMIFY